MTLRHHGHIYYFIFPCHILRQGTFLLGFLLTFVTELWYNKYRHRRIDEIKVGDKVWAFNVETGEAELKTVTKVYVHAVNEVLHLYTDEGDIDTTANHPFYVVGKGWVAAGDLVVGDEVFNLDGTTSVVLGSAIEKLDEPVLVYNLEVEDFHSYFVGCVPVLVHNYCKPYDYGDYNILDSRGDNLDLHHAPQGNPAKQVINGYDYKTGPVIALPSDVHEKLPTIKGSYNGTAKELLQFTKNQLIDAVVPSDIVNNYIDYVKIKYPNNIW